jgi:hypothetical protein
MDIEIPKFDYIDSNIDKVIWRIGKAVEGEAVSFDFSNYRFLRPETVIVLIIASQFVNNRTKLPVKWTNLNGKIPQYLERINISNLPFIKFQRPNAKILWTRSFLVSWNLIEVLHIETPKQIGDVMKHTREILAQWFPEKEGEGYCKQATEFIAGIAGNSLEHSVKNGLGTCYFTLQKYNKTGQRPDVVIAFGDCGIGIRESLKTTIMADDVSAIRLALIEGKSSRANGQGGAGFQTITSLLMKYGGSISIRSGKGSVFYDPKRNYYKSKEHNHSFIGTQTSFIL